jgi:hypothetical protein
VIVPAIPEFIQSGLQTWNENIVTTEEVEIARQIQQAILLCLVQGTVEKACHCCEDIPPEPFNSV